MTIEEFNKTSFFGKMEMTYQDKVYDIVSVDFEEKLFGFKINNYSDDLSWARCENCTLNLYEEDLYFKFKRASIDALIIKKNKGTENLQELCFTQIMKGFENQDADIIRLYLDEDFIKACKDIIDMDLHFFVESILKDKYNYKKALNDSLKELS